MKRALVTGGRGFVGQHLADRLWKDDWDVTVIDIKSGIDCRDVFRHDTTSYDLVVHCAAVVGGRMTIDGQPLQVAVDLAIDSDFVQYVLRTKPARAVYFSSSAAYPVHLQTHERVRTAAYKGQARLREADLPIDQLETMVALGAPDAIYGWVKLTGERLCRIANEQHGAGIYVFRPFSGYGPDQDQGYPFRDMLSRTQDMLRLGSSLNKNLLFPVWGDGTQVRDWVHIDDVVECVVQALDWDPMALGPLNICTGIGTSAGYLARLFIKAAGLNVAEVVPQPDKPVGVQYRVGDPTSMRRVYTPAITVEEGVARALHG